LPFLPPNQQRESTEGVLSVGGRLEKVLPKRNILMNLEMMGVAQPTVSKH